MARWRYALYDLRTRAVLAEHMPFKVDSFTRMLGEAGTVSATLPLGDPAIRARLPRDLILSTRTTLVAFRDESPLWEGIIWNRRRRRGDRENALPIGASEVRSYFDHRVLRPELGYGSAKTLSFTGADILDVFRTLMVDCQELDIGGDYPGDIGVEMDSALSGTLITRTDTAAEQNAYHGYSFTTYGQLFRDLAEGNDPGVEWRIDPYLDTDRILRRRLVVGSPRIGTAEDAAALITVEYPGQITSYEWPDDGERSASYVAAVGSGDGDNLRWAEAINTAQLDAGWPLLEAVTAHKDDSGLTVLTGRATADLAARTGDRTVPSLEVKGYLPVSPGDYVRARIADEDWWPGSSVTPYEAIVRVVGVTHTPGPPEKTGLAIEEPRDG